MTLRGAKSRLFVSSLTALGIVVILLIALFLVGRDVGIQAQSIKTAKNDLKTRSGQLNDLARLRDETKEVSLYLAKLQGAIPTRDGLFSARRELEELAVRHALTINFAFGGENPKEDGLGSINFDAKLTGGDFNIRSFIDEVEARHPFVKIVGLDMVRQENDFSANLKGKILFRENGAD